MKRLWTCRRTFIAFAGLVTLAVLGWRGADVASTIAAITIGLAGANAAEAALPAMGRRP